MGNMMREFQRAYIFCHTAASTVNQYYKSKTNGAVKSLLMQSVGQLYTLCLLSSKPQLCKRPTMMQSYVRNHSCKHGSFDLRLDTT